MKSWSLLGWLGTLCVLGASPSLRAADPDVSLDLGGGLSLRLRLIQPGAFTQGSPSGETGRADDETPHQVTLTRPYYMGVWPVTVAQFTRFAQEARYQTEAEQGTSGGFGWDGTQLVQKKEYSWRNPGFPQTGEHPVTLVSWNDAKAFCGWLSRKSGRNIALPTEAQWEYACRSGTQTACPLGDDVAALESWGWCKSNAGGATHPCGRKSASPWGLCDLGGNVWEWCEDWYAPYPTGILTDPLQTVSTLSDKPRRVLRGGSFLKDAKTLRSAARYRNDAKSRNADNGFRVVTFSMQAAPPPPAPLPQPAESPLPTATPASGPPPNPPVRQRFNPAVPVNPPPPISPVASSGRSSPIPGLLCVLIPIALIGGLIVFLVIKLRGRSVSVSQPFSPATPVPSGPAASSVSASASGSTVRTRIVSDGFWLQATVPAGTPISWSCDVGGQQMQGTVNYNPGPEGQFVFIGRQPAKVSALVSGTITRTTVNPIPPLSTSTGFQRGFGVGTSISPGIHSTPNPPPLHQPPSQGYPSAY